MKELRFTFSSNDLGIPFNIDLVIWLSAFGVLGGVSTTDEFPASPSEDGLVSDSANISKAFSIRLLQLNICLAFSAKNTKTKMNYNFDF